MIDEELYLTQQWFEGRDEDIRMSRTRMLTTRKPRKCCGNGVGEAHEMPKGSRMLVETALYERQWASWALCTNCMDSWLRTIGEIQ